MRVTVFFDGDCAFCSRTIRLLAMADRHDRIRFSPLQGALAQQLGISGCADKSSGTMVAIDEAGVQTMFSDGWITVARALGFPFSQLGWLLKFVPRPLRDAVYRMVARNRYRIAGKKTSCGLPDPEVVRRLV